MAIKATSQGSIPSVDLTYVQYNQLHIAVRNESPYTVAVTGKVQLYGKDADGVRYYDKTVRDLVIPDLDAFIASLSGQDQTDALTAMTKVQEGLGILAQLKLGLTFSAVE